MAPKPAPCSDGDVHGLWIVISSKRERQKVLCRCICGTERMVLHFNLASGQSTSCGCHGNPQKPPKQPKAIRPKRTKTEWVKDPTTGNDVIAGRSLKERFHSKYRIDEGGCWNWTSTTAKESNGDRRAQIRVSGKYVYAARVSYELHAGPIPVGMKVLHECDNPLCVNPSHLFVGTNRDNVIDAIQKGRFTQHIDNLETINQRRRANHGA